MASTRNSDTPIETRQVAQYAETTNLKLPGGFTPAGLIQEADAAAALLDAIEADKRALAAKIAGKDAAIAALADKLKRIRSGVKAEYGDDSTEYESVGGKRSSDRKKPQSKKTEA